MRRAGSTTINHSLELFQRRRSGKIMEGDNDFFACGFCFLNQIPKLAHVLEFNIDQIAEGQPMFKEIESCRLRQGARSPLAEITYRNDFWKGDFLNSAL